MVALNWKQLLGSRNWLDNVGGVVANGKLWGKQGESREQTIDPPLLERELRM